MIENRGYVYGVKFADKSVERALRMQAGCNRFAYNALLHELRENIIMENTPTAPAPV